jgi:hypothetical protein
MLATIGLYCPVTGFDFLNDDDAIFALGLLSKPMVVTLPCVLLLLDYWPLDRFKHSHVRRLVTENIPFFALSVAGSVLTFVVQKREGAVAEGENLSLAVRSGNALISYCRYLGKLDLALAAKAVSSRQPGSSANS